MADAPASSTAAPPGDRLDSWKEITAPGTWWPRWLRDGRHIVTEYEGKLFVVDVIDDVEREILSVDNEVLSDPALSPDGEWLYFARNQQTADVWITNRPR